MDPSKSAILELCDFASSKVSLQHFQDFCPSDAGHSNYVRILAMVYSSRRISKTDGADLSDAYFWTRENEEMDQETMARLRHYRFFLNCVALLLIRQNDYSEHLYPANYSAAEMLMDSSQHSWEVVDLLNKSFGEARQLLAEANHTECLFFRFGQLVLSERLGDPEQAGRYASLLLREEAEMISDPKTKYLFEDSRFLLGASTGYDKYDKEWKALAFNLQNPGNDLDVALIRNVIQNDSWPGAPENWQAADSSTDH